MGTCSASSAIADMKPSDRAIAAAYLGFWPLCLAVATLPISSWWPSRAIGISGALLIAVGLGRESALKEGTPS